MKVLIIYISILIEFIKTILRGKNKNEIVNVLRPVILVQDL